MNTFSDTSFFPKKKEIEPLVHHIVLLYDSISYSLTLLLRHKDMEPVAYT